MNVALFIASFLFVRAQCAKILGVFAAPGYSQFILGEVLMTELAKRGHQITVISPYRPKDEPPNYKTILTKEVIGDTNGDDSLWNLESQSLFKNIMSTYDYENGITEKTLQNKEVQELLQSNEHFDLVIVEQFFNDALKGFSAHFKAPLVLFSSMGLTEWNREYMGVPMLPSMNAVSYTQYTNRMTFFQRIRNLYGTIFDYLYRRYFFYPVQRKFLAQYFPSSLDFDKILYNASLMLLNSHVTTSENTLLPYNMVEIGGFHVINKPLDKEIQTFLDGATDGAILFSLGSNLHSSDLSQDTRNAIFQVFAKLKQKILWKFETDLPDKPKNLFIAKWLKQRDILAHPNVKLFITHGGLLSTEEAIFNGVPMVGIPVFADQKMNMARAKSNGVASVVSFSKLSEETLFEAVNETLKNPSYRNNAKRLSSMIKDRPIQPLELAMYWIEYTMRHSGMTFKPSSLYLYWFEMYMVDIACFLLINSLVVFLVIFGLMRICKSKKSDKQKKQ
ncbi:UDP-glycosyltransferase UGT5-like [Zophobas morio]|uniref:UDP-glycosyltransferase UGT5-like n=1 Tax=Zophobas morio TaxID=2755281 RepID=UPI0030834BDC